MNSYRMKTQDLTGPALDWAVAVIEKLPMDLLAWQDGKPVIQRTVLGHTDNLRCEFSTNWAQGGPIIEREGIAIDCVRCDGRIDGWQAANEIAGDENWDANVQYGPTPLIAAMRCYVASVLGDTVEIPEELK